MSTGERIKQRRKELGISPEKLAEKIGVSRSTIFRYENGYIEKIPTEVITPLAEMLQTTVEYLLGTSDSPERETPVPTGDLMALREQLRRQPGMRILFEVSKGATEEDLLDAARLIEGFRRRREGDD